MIIRYQIDPSVGRARAMDCLTDPTEFADLISEQITDFCGDPKYHIDKTVAGNGAWENRRTIIWLHTGRPWELPQRYEDIDHIQMDYLWQVGQATGWDVSVTGMLFVVSDLSSGRWTTRDCTRLADSLDELFQDWQVDT